MPPACGVKLQCTDRYFSQIHLLKRGANLAGAMGGEISYACGVKLQCTDRYFSQIHFLKRGANLAGAWGMRFPTLAG